ncbi:hypothetical protein ACHHYP_10592 [Achlya hypogyna]|uniref:Uncharacterized protein n=1 Tax=Achlya hypogyna TaxID=1202772 RepID=A0A1V9YKZ5_ACHHY|nr:hypothetical protein ACHHYP_10592 [Achlya hypogyna]
MATNGFFDDTNNEHDETQEAPRRKTPFRFEGCTDVDLLKEVIHVRPFDAPYGEVKNLTVNGTRKRYEDLMIAFKEATLVSLRASGTDEEYEEREQLRQDINPGKADRRECRDWLVERAKIRRDFVVPLERACHIVFVRESRQLRFMASTQKKDSLLRFLPINLYVQEMHVAKSKGLHADTAVYETEVSCLALPP